MIKIYGTQFLVDDDVFSECGRPRNIIGFLQCEYERLLDDLRDSMITYFFEETLDSAEFNLRFVPLEVVEEYMLYRSIESGLKAATKCMASSRRKSINDYEDILGAAKRKLEYIQDIYDYHKDAENSVCVAFILNPKNELKDVCVAIPRKVKSKIMEPRVYRCSECNHTEIVNNDLPNTMHYNIKDDKVVYYCDECVRHTENAVHVGEEFYNKR